MQAPMAGGASTPELAAAVSEAGGLGFLAAGYRTAAQMRQEIERTRELTSHPFGVNVFMPTADDVDQAEIDDYARAIGKEARRLSTTLGVPVGGDDDFPAKVADLLADPPAMVGFTFGCPQDELVQAFRDRGTTVVVTVTSGGRGRGPPAPPPPPPPPGGGRRAPRAGTNTPPPAQPPAAPRGD
ncbi:nitronate monooxygenase, partial [Streptosporangium sp. NPDC000095]|uniref:nitronate monooxygenase n=1 Tax=Streptosporangium sp. NPDC000095 TaxID=3366184 RepID=UPI0036BC32DA